MELKTEFSNEVSYLQTKYPQKLQSVIDYSIEDAIAIYKNRRGTPEQTEFKDYEKNWIRRCASQLLNAEGYEGFSSYTENGYSWERFEGELSPTLLAEVFPKVKVFED